MLYDPRWERKTKADPFSLESLIAWLERQPREERYWYLSGRNCVLARYFSARGFAQVCVGGTSWRYGRHRKPLPFGFSKASLPEWSWATLGLTSSYGAALDRARIAIQVGIPEAEVANRLPGIRERARRDTEWGEP